MKIKKIVILICALILVSGCNNKNNFDDYEHYNLKETISQINYYTFDDNTSYAVTDIQTGDESGINGIFYKVSKDDYILLDIIYACNNPSLYKYREYTYFYQGRNNSNRLFIVRCLGGTLLEYTFNNNKFEKKNLTFDYSEIDEDINLYDHYIEKVEENYIYYQATNNKDREKMMIKCSLENYKCELYK